jgi:putative spermidine/putrescine transport system substrate-binding protein
MINRAPVTCRLGGSLLQGCGMALAIGWLAVAAPCASAQDAPAGDAKPSRGSLSIATWGGAYGQSQDIAYFQPFTKKTGVKITTETYDGTLAAIEDKIGGSTSQFDVVDLSQGALDVLCRDGKLEALESSILDAAPGGQSVSDDFIAGGINPCGIASVAWSAVIAFDRQAFAKAQPMKIADLLDIQRFPGKRALPNAPRYTLELALLADGVDPKDVYRELATPEGADRAFKALDKIKAQILWWDKAEDAIALLMQRKAAMAAGYSGRIFRAAVAARQRVDVLWDGQIYDLDLWAIPKGAANKDDAKRFIAFATEPAQMAAQAALIAYGPMRRSAIALVGKHPSIEIEMKEYLPTAPDNFRKALKFDEGWWNEHGAELAMRFQTWRDQPAAIDAKASPANAKAKPSTPDSKSSTGQGKPTTTERKPSAADSKPSPSDRKPSTEDETGAAPDRPE